MRLLTDPELRAAFLEYKNLVYRFAYRMTNSATAAEDILQDVFVALLHDRSRFDERRSALGPFLLGITRNLALKRIRRDGRWTPLDDEEQVAAPQSELADFDAGQAVALAVQTLPPLQREALILYTYEEMPLLNIAQLTEVSVGTVKARLHRAREKLKQLLAPLRTDEVKGGLPKWNVRARMNLIVCCWSGVFLMQRRICHC